MLQHIARQSGAAAAPADAHSDAEPSDLADRVLHELTELAQQASEPAAAAAAAAVMEPAEQQRLHAAQTAVGGSRMQQLPQPAAAADAGNAEAAPLPEDDPAERERRAKAALHAR